jgi:hypothetical protein
VARTNFTNPPLQPAGQRRWVSIPVVEILESDDAGTLGVLINAFIVSLALPHNQDFRYTINEIQYTSAQVANNLVTYSALIHYTVWDLE